MDMTHDHTHGHATHGAAPMNMDMDMGMKMYFHSGFGDVLLIKQFVIDSTVKMFLVCGLLFVASLLHEFVKYVRCVRCGCLPSRSQRYLVSDVAGDGGSTGPDGGCCNGGGNTTQANGNIQLNGLAQVEHSCYVGRFRGRQHRMVQACLHGLQTSLGIVIMLAAMSFNLCIIFAIVAGAIVGFYLFYRPYNEIEAIDSCH